MTTRGQSIGIRPFRQDDLQPFYQAVRESLEHLQPFMPWAHAEYAMEDARSWVESRPQAWEDAEEYSFIIYSLDDGQLLGGMGLNQINPAHGIGNIGYWVRKSALGQGAASEGTRLVARFGFEELGLTRLEIVMLTSNPASRRVAEKSGACFEGVQRNRLVVGGRPMDGYMFSLIPEDLSINPA